jgi:hypothetical protein
VIVIRIVDLPSVAGQDDVGEALLGKLEMALDFRASPAPCFTIRQYMGIFHPYYLQCHEELGGDAAFLEDCAWMNRKEAHWRLPAMHNGAGERVYHIWLLEWMHSERSRDGA